MIRMMLVGPASAGKTLIVRKLHEGLPGLTRGELRVLGRPDWATMVGKRPSRPLRVPHHTVSGQGLLEEASQARCGVFLLDDVTEFRSDVLVLLGAYLNEAQPKPLMLVATALDCPCGRAGATNVCLCTEEQRETRRHRHQSIAILLGMSMIINVTEARIL